MKIFISLAAKDKRIIGIHTLKLRKGVQPSTFYWVEFTWPCLSQIDSSEVSGSRVGDERVNSIC